METPKYLMELMLFNSQSRSTCTDFCEEPNKEDLKLEPCTGLYFFCFDESLKLAEILIGPHHKEKEDDIERRIEKLMDNDEYRDPKPEIFRTQLSPFTFEIKKET